ncbi:SMP-30/gluconolactonase/LRE family protein [Colwellia sp. 1_MG-2023]|uniref:SMP-30/gluconolactonase/LRE family protein n=1 Tax=unclassified Colwellia TaxID=196834 RepID=UPI001C08FA36|nr:MULTISPECIES: SMP-30/gluconolactonase/LRE family protein [unclassified Colwellia]MBU2924281.1 SMP-30/gluconolactonase/LRE family protein [Colwellia sp. C2M11]MDO6652990.1 SMP-30/gluconolactonase/LRE family protein [Colwellia sp. 3_MG-2023]MDO6665472.1 SMP-30/gluconolactonase/LRE family protein [Colwellia sp. 2_MG-2023]MDO6689769.1 SMP-30/gluconolactonase/LRE family protein [Colwellia sp. 1_MG-2023]
MRLKNHPKIVKVTVLTFMLGACSIQSSINDSVVKPFSMNDAEETIGSIDIYDDKAYQYLDNETLVSVRGKGFDWVEGPVWVADGNYLLFSDIPKNLIRKFSIAHGNQIYLENTGFSAPSAKGPGSNGLLINQKNELVLLQTGERQVSLMQAPLNQPKARFTNLVNNYHGMRLNGTNDGVFDQQGNLYFTDPAIGLDVVFKAGDNRQEKRLVEKQYKKPLTREKRVQQTPFAGVYRLSVHGELILVDDTLTVPNGIALSPDDKTLYVSVSDKRAPAWFVYDVQDDGSLANRREFFNAQYLIGQPEQQGLPDGMAVHSSGVIFATGPGGVWLFSPEGEVLAKIKTGLATSNCTFTTDEKTLYITADDNLLSIPIK